MLPGELEDFLEYFRGIVSFLQEYSWLYKAPVTNILISDILSMIPHSWIEPLLNLSNEELNNVPLWFMKDQWPLSLLTFMRDCQRLTLPVLTDGTSLDCRRHDDDVPAPVPAGLWRGMSPKKREEVEMMTDVVHRECRLFGINNIVDLGSGLGYVDRLLLLRGYKILGIESQTKLVKFATDQKDNIFPNELAMNLKYYNLNISEDSIPEVSRLIAKSLLKEADEAIENCSGNVNNDGSFRRELHTNCQNETVNEDRKKVCMIGLHACGDLAVAGLKMYLSLPEVSSLILIPCCYHKMSLSSDQSREEFEAVEDKFNNFPLSETLVSVCAELGESFICRPLLRLASQATGSGWLGWSETDHRQHAFNVLSRAVVELYMHKENTTFKKCFRRLARKTSLKTQDFTIYVDEILNRSECTNENAEINVEDAKRKIQSDLLCLWEQHKDKLCLVEVLTGLQMCLESVVESLIVADRICYLREQGVNNVRVVKIIDKKLSPRCLAFVASKR